MQRVLRMFQLCVILLTTFKVTTASDAPVVQTKLGALRGEYMTAVGKATVVHSYLSVPFATPPVGPLRFVPPQPVEGWQGLRDATKMPPMCIQDRELLVNLLANVSTVLEVPDTSEDCLYLNIYTPAKPSEDTKLPVMVWIHGGALTMGAASMSDGSILAAYQNVVVVIIQYRLGVLGFFSTGDEHAPGNYGMLDQVAALQWVQEHIHSFGGNPASVTIFGESAGGVSVSMQILSPLSAGLFHRAIAQSGTAFMETLTSPNLLATAKEVGKALDCDLSTQEMIACIKQKSTNDIQKVQQENPMLFFGVTEDGQFLPGTYKEILGGTDFNKVPLMTGVTNDECGWLLPTFLAPAGWTDGMDREQVLNMMALDPREKWVKELLVDEYVGSTTDRTKLRDAATEIMSDYMFNIPTLKLAKYHRGGGAPVYLYEFQHPPSMLQAKRASFVGVDHGDDLPFVFGACFANGHIKMNTPFTEEENRFCETVMAYWGNFARTGSPNGPGLTHWPEYGDEAEYLGIGLQQRPGKNLKGNHFSFLTETLPEMIRLRQGKREHTEL